MSRLTIIREHVLNLLVEDGIRGLVQRLGVVNSSFRIDDEDLRRRNPDGLVRFDVGMAITETGEKTSIRLREEVRHVAQSGNLKLNIALKTKR